MNLLTHDSYPALSTVIHNFVDEVDIHKAVIERTLDDHADICSMMVFYTTSTQKDYLIALPHSATFEESLPQLSQALHFYAARQSSAVLVMLPSDIALDDKVYKSANFFIASKLLAFAFYLPYTVAPDNTVIWHDDLSILEDLEKVNVDQNGQDFIHLLHAHVHTERAPFGPDEILNYLSYHGFAIQALDEHSTVSYIDMSNLTDIAKLPL